MFIAIALLFLTGYLATVIAAPIARSSGLRSAIAFDLVCGLLFVLVYKFAICRLGEIKRDDLRNDHALRNLGVGIAAGAGLFALVAAVAALFGVYRIVGWGDASDFVPALILAGIFPAISEEMVFRGVLFRWIEEFGGSWAALIVTSALFGASHLLNPNATWIAAVGIAVEAGLMLGGAYMLTRSLWLPMGIHAAWNFAQGEVFDVPVSGTDVHGLVDARLSGNPLLSGGAFGLEASLIAMIGSLLFGGAVLAMAVRKGEVMRPWWVRRREAADQRKL